MVFFLSKSKKKGYSKELKCKREHINVFINNDLQTGGTHFIL